MRAAPGVMAGRTSVLVGVLGTVGSVLVSGAAVVHGWAGAVTAATAWCICLTGGVLSLRLCECRRDPEHVMQQVMWGLLLRMGLPLLACVGAYLHGGMLAQAGFVYYIMAFYFVTLAVETFLLVARQAGDRRGDS